MRRRGQLLVAAVVSVLGIVPPLAAAAQVPRVVVSTGVDSIANTHDVANDTPVAFRIVLRPSNQLALTALLAAQRDPTSPNFHRYLTAAEFARTFQPSRRDVSELVSYFASFGVSVTYDTRSLLLRAEGTASDVEAALRTDIRRSTADQGLIVARGDVTLPNTFATEVSGVVGLSRPTRAHHHVTETPKTSGPPVTRCYGAEFSSGLTAQDQASLYGIDQLWSTGARGVGHTIALYELAKYRPSDLAAYFSCYGISPTITNTNISGGANGYDAEVALDIQQAGVLAPGANLAVYSAPNDNTGPVDLFAKIAADNSADIVSISWGICEAATDASAEAPIFQQMAAQGQTVLAAAGDAGSSDCQPVDGTSTLSVDDPASQPYVTAVGGTHITSFDPFHERVWNDGSGAGGGGVSSVFPRPDWQSAPGMDSGSMREIPDLSVTADPRVGFPAYYSGRWTTYGGTSIGAPILSGLLAVAAQSCSASRFGFLNPMLYSMARRGVGFRDVTEGSNDLFDTGSYAATTGYDMASGLGSPDPATFAAALCPSQPSSVTTTLTSDATTVDRNATLDLALRDSNGSLLATTIPVVTASQSGATPSVTVSPPVAADSTHRIEMTTDRPGVVTVTVTVAGVTVITSTATFTSPLTVRNVTSTVAALNATGSLRASTLSSNIVVVGQRADHHVVIGSSGGGAIRDLTVLAKAPLASAAPDIDCWRSICSVTYRANTKLIVITNVWSPKPKVLTLSAAIGAASQPRIGVLAVGSATSYVTAAGRLAIVVASDVGLLTRTYTVGTNVRGTTEVTRDALGRFRVLARTTTGISAFSNQAGTSVTTTVIVTRSNLSSGPFVVGINPEVVLSTSGTSVVASDGTDVTVSSSVPIAIPGAGAGFALTLDAGVITLWCSTPTWRSLDVVGTLGVTGLTPSVSGTGDAVLLTSGSTTWALTR